MTVSHYSGFKSLAEFSATREPTAALEEFDRKNAELAEWRRLEPAVKPAVKSLSDYRVLVASGLMDAGVELADAPSPNPGPDLLRQVHQTAFGEAMQSAGDFRQPGQQVLFGGRTGADPRRIVIEQARLRVEMEELLEHATTAEDRCAAVAFYHARFIGIHPFQDGNGRVGRAVLGSQIQALSADPSGGKFSQIGLLKNKAGYIAALGAALDTNDIAPLTRLVAECSGVKFEHVGPLIASARVACRPMLSLDDVYPLATEREIERTGFPPPLPSIQGGGLAMGR